MAYSRYYNRSTFINDATPYRQTLFSDRGITRLEQYDTAVFSYPSEGEMVSLLEIEVERWHAASKLYNLAYEYYGDPTLWWLIGWFNRKPTDGHYEVGDIVYIPLPADAAIGIFEGSQ